MSIFVVGVNHKTAPVAIREQVAFPAEQLDEALAALKAMTHGTQENLILSTCNRTELYAAGTDARTPQQLAHWLADFHALPPAQLEPHLFVHQQQDAVRHALRVACGLDSLILGEPQILGQLKTALQEATRRGNTGHNLSRLMQHAFTTAKKVRTETRIGANPVSVAFAAVSLARRIFSDLGEQTALLVGAGETMELVGRHLSGQHIGHLIIANRNLERARVLAGSLNGSAIALTDIGEHLHQADVVISSTASPLPVIGKGMVESALRRRKHRPVFMVDIAVPRDIEPEVGDLDDVYLYTVDDLQSVIEENLRSRQAAAEQAETMISNEVQHFMGWLRAQEQMAVIREFRHQVGLTRDDVLEKARRMLETKGADEALNFLAHTLSNKLAHAPTQAMNQAAHQGDSHLLEQARILFNLKTDPNP
ncbi:MAG: glutamyl-tRNA reductase [Thiothrix sp.]|nr:glutamyl-tRNA reductase [Thiothrix sp.]HPQ95823.1 glutamyl-tRNA reductase [Thiolinea sp.]